MTLLQLWTAPQVPQMQPLWVGNWCFWIFLEETFKTLQPQDLAKATIFSMSDSAELASLLPVSSCAQLPGWSWVHHCGAGGLAEDSKPRKLFLIFTPGPVFGWSTTVILQDFELASSFGHATCSTDPTFASMSPVRTSPGPALSWHSRKNRGYSTLIDCYSSKTVVSWRWALLQKSWPLGIPLAWHWRSNMEVSINGGGTLKWMVYRFGGTPI